MAELIHDGESIEVEDGAPLKPTLEEMGVPFACEEGICGTCVIEIIEGGENLTEKTEEEEDFLGDVENERLGCQCKLKSGKVEVEF